MGTMSAPAVAVPTLEQVRAACVRHIPAGDVWLLAGPRNSAERQQFMLAITGRKLPRVECGVNALRQALVDAGAPNHGPCDAVRDASLATWIRTGKVPA